MHLSDGVLSPAVLITGAALTTAGVAVGLKKLNTEEIPAVGVLTAGFFVASLVHVPVGPASVHMALNGLLGFLLGWKAFPSILVGLTLQALFFQHGGITTLGVNTLNMALPAVLCRYLFGWGARAGTGMSVLIINAFACGFCAILINGLMVGFSLYLTGVAFVTAAKVIIAAQLPVMLVEGALTASCAVFLRRVRPELLERQYAPRPR